MSIPLVAAVTAAVALNATTTTVEPVNVVAAPRYDPCATTQLINSAPIARPVHRPKHHAAPHRKIAAVAKVAVVKAPAAKPRLIKAHNPHKRLKRKRPIPEAYTQQTCAAPTGGIAPLDFASLMQPTAYLPPLPEGARAVDVAATTPAALGDSDTPAAGNLAPFNDDPFVLGPGGLGRGGGSPAGGGGGGGGAGGGSAPGGGGSGGSGPGGGPSGGGSTPPTPTPPNPGTPGGSGAPTGSTPISAVPEPASWMSMLTGFAILGGIMRGRRAAALAGRRKA